MKIKNIKAALVYLVFISSCASTEHIVRTEPATPKDLPPAQSQEGEFNVKTIPLAQLPVAPVTTEASASPQTVPSKPMTAAAVTVAKQKAPAGVAPEQALKWLKNGNRRFTKGLFRNDGVSKKDIERLALGQKPHSIILSSSDSRLSPEIVFDQKLGEIFVVRAIGEALDSLAVVSIEYAVEHLGSRNILIMGNSQCGITKTAAVKMIDQCWSNTKNVAKDLMDRSEIVAEKVRAGDVKINTALYHLESGKAEFTQ